MGKIQVLDTMLTNMIAAGEVVERIASVVKELTENSIDAGATKIKIALTDSGLSEIKVSDNGSGMDARDAKMCILPHATSKIREREDLFSIRTLGFRGEALASIASISNFKIITSTDGYHGIMITWRGGDLLSEATIAHPKGTDVIVKNLFFNTPVRLQSLQSQNVELGYVIDYVSKMALARPNVAFELNNNNKILVNTFGNNDVNEAIYAIYGAKVAKAMVPVFDSNSLYRIEGFISKIQETRSTKNNIVLSINGRIIRNYNIVNAIIAGYSNKLMNGRYPICLINIKVDTTMVDVNVHPSKLEVRFSKEEDLKSLITNAIKKTLELTDLSVDVSNNDKEEENIFARYKNIDNIEETLDNPNDIASTLDNLMLIEEQANEKKVALEKETELSSPFEEDKESVNTENSDEVENSNEFDNSNELLNSLESEEELDDDKIEEDYNAEDEVVNEIETNNDDIPFEYDSIFDEDDKEITDLLANDRLINSGNEYMESDSSLVLNEESADYGIIEPFEQPESVEFDANEAEIGLSEKFNNSKVKYEQLTIEEELKNVEKELNDEISNENVMGTAQNLPNLNYIGQLFGTYILANDENIFYLIDQHAAMERINYEKIKNELMNSNTLTYDLLIPFNIEFSPKDCYLVNENINLIESLGIKIEEFGNNSFVVRSIPTWIFRGKEKEFVEEIISKIINATQDKEYNKAFFLDSIAKSLACKKSIKGNEFHSELEIKFLLEELSHTINPYTCPHGRPVIIKITKDEVEKWFKRIV